MYISANTFQNNGENSKVCHSGMIALLFMVCPVLFPIPMAWSQPVMETYEHSMEITRITYKVRKDGYGKASVPRCPECRTRPEFEITPETKLIFNGNETPFSEHPMAKEAIGSIFYLPTERRLTRIMISQPPQ